LNKVSAFRLYGAGRELRGWDSRASELIRDFRIYHGIGNRTGKRGEKTKGRAEKKEKDVFY
jgi:hypothetical protein